MLFDFTYSPPYDDLPPGDVPDYIVDENLNFMATG